MTPVRRAAIAAFCSVVFTVGALAQSPTYTSPKPATTVGVVPPPRPPIPDTLLFQFFFIHVDAIKSASDKLTASGKGIGKGHEQIMKLAGVTDAEAGLIEQVASNCVSQVKAFYASTRSQRAGLIQQLKQGDAAAADANRQGAQLDADRDKVLANCMQKLQWGMGDARYQQVKTRVYFAERPAIKSAPSQTTTTTSATTKAAQ